MEQFEIFSILQFNFLFTNVVFYLFLAGVFSISLTYIGTGGGVLNIRNRLIPTTFGITHESLFRSILQMVDTYMSTIYFPQIYTIFHIILFCNLIGQVPYSSTPTVEVIMTQSLAFTILIGVLIQGFLSHKLYLQSAFLPAGTPVGQIILIVFLEVLAYFTRIISLGLRQAVNLITGHILVKVCVSFIWIGYLNGTSIFFLIIPMFLLTLFLALELLIAYQQAYIFTFITCITFKDMTN